MSLPKISQFSTHQKPHFKLTKMKPQGNSNTEKLIFEHFIYELQKYLRNFPWKALNSWKMFFAKLLQYFRRIFSLESYWEMTGFFIADNLVKALEIDGDFGLIKWLGKFVMTWLESLKCNLLNFFNFLFRNLYKAYQYYRAAP